MEIRKNLYHKKFYRLRHYTQKEMKFIYIRTQMMMMFFVEFDRRNARSISAIDVLNGG